jgi:hypothetical protein
MQRSDALFEFVATTVTNHSSPKPVAISADRCSETPPGSGPVWLVEVATDPAPRLDGLASRLAERTPIPCQPEGVSSRG